MTIINLGVKKILNGHIFNEFQVYLVDNIHEKVFRKFEQNRSSFDDMVDETPQFSTKKVPDNQAMRPKAT